MKKKIIPFLLLAAVLITAPFSYTLARYISEENTQATISSDEFYFESDLTDTSVTSCAPQIEFNLTNYMDELRVSSSDIEYTVLITDSVGTQVYAAEGTLTHTAHITAPITADGAYTVTVKSTTPYEKTITRTVNVTKLDKISGFSLTEPSISTGVYKLKISTGDFGTDTLFTLSYSGAIPDPTDRNLSGAGAASHKLTLSQNSTYILRFFANNAALTISNFTIA